MSNLKIEAIYDGAVVKSQTIKSSSDFEYNKFLGVTAHSIKVSGEVSSFKDMRLLVKFLDKMSPCIPPEFGIAQPFIQK